MGRVVRLVSWIVVFASLGATTAAWVVLARDRPDLDAADATEVALGALAEVGVDGTVDGAPTLIGHTPEDGESIRAWSVIVQVGDDGVEIELRVRENAGQLVYVDDNVGDGDRLLTDEEFERIGSYRDDTVIDTVRRRNIGATVATLLIAVVGYTIAKRSRTAWSPA